MKNTMQIVELTIKCPACDNVFNTTDFNLKYDAARHRLEAYYISCAQCASDFTPVLNLNDFEGGRNEPRD